MNINNVSIGKKLGLGFSFITLMTIIVGLFSILELKKEADLTEQIFYHPYSVNRAVNNINIDIMRIHTLLGLLTTNERKENLNNITKKFNKYNENIQNNFKLIFKQYLGPKTDIQKASDTYEQSRTFQIKIIDAIIAGDIQKARDNIDKNANKYFENLHKEMHILSDFANEKATHFFNKSQQEEYKTINYLIFALIFIIMISISASIFIIRSITDPLHHLIDLSDRIKDGDITLYKTAEVNTLSQRKDEIGLLYKQFNTIMSYLLLPYKDMIKCDRPLIEKTDELRRLLASFDKYIIASKTDKNGKMIYASKAFQNISGYCIDELIGQRPSIVHHNDMPKDKFVDLWKTIQNGEIWTGQIKNKAKNGEAFWIETHISPDLDRDGNIIGYNSISENITSLKAYEELSATLEYRVIKEMKKNQEQAAHMLQNSRLAQMGEMISMIAHQWRQPLASISAISGSMSLDIAMDNYDEKSFQNELNSISELSIHLSRTIDDFRNFYKEDKEKEEASLEEIIDGCMHIIKPTLNNMQIDVIVDIEKDIFIISYINEIKQVILNIIKNAEDALKEHHIKDAKIWISTYQDEEDACINIKDNAGGIPDDIIDQVFNPYFSTKKKKEGTGIGLYMSKMIIEENCYGELKLSNTEDGASFTIKIPMNEEVLES